jgi:hypothetical protein
VCSPSLGTLNHTGPSSAAIQRRGAVQKHTQSTQRLSIQIEVGSRLTGPCRRVGESSSVRTCRWGGCSKSFRGYWLGLSDGAFSAPSLGTKETGGQSRSCLPRPFSVGRRWVRQESPAVNWAPGRSSQSNRRIAGLAQRRAGALERQRFCSATDRGLAFERIQLGVRVGCDRGQISSGPARRPADPGRTRFYS